jgi:hypothetical protein
MADNGIGVPPPPVPNTQRWRDEIRAQHLCLKPEEPDDPTGNDAWWWDFFQACYDTDM